MKTIVVTRGTFELLQNVQAPGKVVYLAHRPRGLHVEVDMEDEVVRALFLVNPDMDMAIRTLLGGRCMVVPA